MLYPNYILLQLLFFIQSTQSAKILGIYPINSKSHFCIHETITKALALRGHHITMISHFKSTKNLPNITEIVLNETVINLVDGVSIEDTKNLGGFWSNIFKEQEVETKLCHLIFNSDYIKKLVTSTDEKIDAIITQTCNTQCYHLLAHALNVPIILVSPPSIMPSVDYYAGNPHNPSYIPLVGIPFTTKMNFWQRVQNVALFGVVYWYRIYWYNDDNKNMARKYFNMELPTDEVLNQRTVLGMYNNHFSLIGRPKSPNIIDIGGIHIKPAKNLPKDLEDFIEESPHGVILFSFGSSIKASSMSTEKLQILLEVFSSIPQRVLWRVDDMEFMEVPSNVKLSKWLPQRDVLEHKNIVAFISHCGIFSTLEALHTATPVVGIPFRYDQFQNAKILVEKEVGIYVDYHTMDIESFASAIKKIVSPQFHRNMNRLSSIFKDRPMSATDEAMYWIEYVLRNQGAPHLRTAAADMPLHEYLLMDMIIYIFVVITCITYLFRLTLRFVKNLIV